MPSGPKLRKIALRRPGADGADGVPPGAGSDERIAVGVPLGRIKPRHLRDSPELVLRSQSRSPAAERFRRLKTLLEHDAEGAPQVIVVTSAAPGEGKSIIAMNLALAFAAERDTETLLIDADLRRSGVARWLDPAPSLGLAEVLSGRLDLEQALLHFSDTPLQVLAAGAPPDDPVELLASEYCRVLVATLRKRYRRIIVDTPPVLPFTDADVLGRLADGIVVVARSGHTPKGLYVQAVESISSARILGVVLNDTVFNLADRGEYYDSYYNRYYGSSGKDRKS